MQMSMVRRRQARSFRKVVGIVAVAGALLVPNVCPAASVPSRAKSSAPLEVATTERGTEITVKYVRSNALIANPERGLYHHTGDCDDEPFDRSELAAFRTQEHVNLVMCIFYLRGLTGRTIPESTLSFFDQQAQTVREAGLKMILRFAYTDADGADAPVDRVLAHIEQLAPYLRSNSDVIDVVQSGFVGRWGEGYFTQNYGNRGNVSPADWAHRKMIVEALLDALPRSRMVALRTPMMKRAMYGSSPVTSSRAYDGSALARIGHHNDCFLASADDEGTYDDPAVEYPYLGADTTYVAMGGETCGVNPTRSDCPTAMSELSRFHHGYLNTDYHPDVLRRWREQGCMVQVERRLGYRFTLTTGRFTTSVRRRGTLSVQISVRNTGFAAPHNPRPAWLVLRRAATPAASYRFRLDANPRRWRPGSTAALKQSFRIPSRVLPGRYELLLSLPDAATRLRGRAAYSVRMANTYTWEPATGMNKLLATVVVR